MKTSSLFSAHCLLIVLLASCQEPSELQGTSTVAPKPKVAQSQAAASQERTTPLDSLFLFVRPPQNLKVKQAAKGKDDKEEPAPLTGKHIGAAFDLIELSLQTQLSEVQKQKLKEAVIAEYDAGGERQEGVLSLPLAWFALEEVYKKAPSDKKQDFLNKNRQSFLQATRNAPNELYRTVILSIAEAADNIVEPGPPAMSQQDLDNLTEAFAFLGSVYLGKRFTFAPKDQESIQTAIRTAYKSLPTETRKRFAINSKQPSILWSLLRGQWSMMDSKQKLTFRAGIVQLLGYPVVNGDAKLGAKLLLAKDGEALSKDVTALLVPKVSAVLEELSSLPEPDASMLGFMIYDY